MNYRKEIDYIVDEIRKYYLPFDKKSAIIGMSGGKDSTICAMLLIKALGKDNVYGVLMPNGEQMDINDSIAICDTFKIKYDMIDIYWLYNIITSCTDVCLSAQAKTNIAPRIRTMILRAIGQTIGAKLCNTSNGSEYYIGWCTIDGDMSHDKLAPLLPYTCVEVVEMGKILAEEFGLDESLIVKVPADGLTDKSDEDNFGFTYQQLHDYQRIGTSGRKDIDEIIYSKHKNSEFKRDRTPFPLCTLEELERMNRCD